MSTATRAFAAVLCAGALGLGAQQPARSAAPWIEAAPTTPGERALRDAFSADASPEALLRVAEGAPASATSGLARLAAGWALLEAQRADEAVSVLRHPDVQRTALHDHAQFALARALELGGDADSALATYRLAASAAAGAPLACVALSRAAELAASLRRAADAAQAYEALAQSCPVQAARAWMRAGESYEALGDMRQASAAYTRVEQEFSRSSFALSALIKRGALARHLPPETPAERAQRQARQALASFEAGQTRAAADALRVALDSQVDAKSEMADLLRVRLGRALVATRRAAAGQALWRAVPPSSPHFPEAAYHLALAIKKPEQRDAAYELLIARAPASPWAEQALLDLANFHQRQARDREALPYYRRLHESFPEGRYADRVAWRVGYGDVRAGRFEAGALTLERAARTRPVTGFTPGYLYWAARARHSLGQSARERQLLEETVQRFKRSYHGQRAARALAALGPAASPAPLLVAASPLPAADLSEPEHTRVRQLLLIERLDEALAELRAAPHSSTAQATIAWLEARRGRLRPAINAMKRAFPGWVGAAGEALPEHVQQILYPLGFREQIEARAAQAGVDAALVAALICQESTFDPGAVSQVGARGLMQIMPYTGRALARSLGVRFRRDALHDPATSLTFGTTYLRDMLARFGGREERALAAYNAGPHRVDAWTSERPDVSAEEFIETIPFTETRNYVMTILSNREQYRRIYGLGSARPVASATSWPSAPAPR
jgi:soluble lytic murein transglycosylase